MMENRKKIVSALTVIPARGGSKGIPRKNLALIGGKPLVAFTLHAAADAKLPGKICLSTDDEEIRAAGLKIPGVEAPFLRPSRLARDGSPTAPVVAHALSWYEKREKFFPEFLLLLQPTCPFRTSATVRGAYGFMMRAKANSLIGVNPVQEHPCEYVMMKKKGFSYCMKPPEKPGRQHYPKVYFINGAIVVTRTSYFKRTGKLYDADAALYVMDRAESLDIDEPLDLAYANWFYENKYAAFQKGRSRGHS